MNELIDVLHAAHCDNARLQYYAERPDGRRISIMPVTPFVYEFFLFNSLYEIDWAASSPDHLALHPDDVSEPRKQHAFLAFLRQHARQRPADLFRAFEPLLYVDRAQGEWTRVTPDARISAAAGDAFFRRIRELQDLLGQAGQASAMPTTKRVFELLGECTHFVYRVRNAVFHGSKTLGEIYENDQKRRIEIYDVFLKGVTSLFFLAWGKDTAACDLVPCPVSSTALPGEPAGEVMDPAAILHATALGLMKVGDARLVARCTGSIPPPPVAEPPDRRAALFYPSAGTDFVTPLLLGLPYCTQFFFYEHNRPATPRPPLAAVLRSVRGVEIGTRSPHWTTAGTRDSLAFAFNGIPRQVHWVHADNREFLGTDVDLAFYFHRGDSLGEGGSGQRWDSELLPELVRMVPPGRSCVCLTDGEPGGLNARLLDSSLALDMPFIGGGRTYHLGMVRKPLLTGESRS